MNKGIIVAGSLILDRHYAVATYPEEGRLTKIRPGQDDAGGTGNLIIDLAKLDANLSVQVSAVLGSGSAGRAVRRQLARFSNISTEGIVEHGHTSMTMVMDADDTQQRTFFYFPGASDIFCDTYISWDKLDGDIFQLEYLLLMQGLDADDPEYGTHAARILDKARRRGMKTSVDMVSEKSSRVPRIVNAALRYTDYCTINELEAQEVTGIELVRQGALVRENRRPVLEKLRDAGVTTWVIVHAAEGSFGMDCSTGRCYGVPNLPLPDGYIKGKTGAGDAYCAGVLYAAYRGQTILQAMELGTACASCSLSEINGTDGMRSYEQVQELYRRFRPEQEKENYETF